MEVDVARVRSRPVPIDPQTLTFLIRTPEDKRFLEDPTFQAKAKNSLRIDYIGVTPQHPETELRKGGVLYESATAFRDFFATHVVIDDEERFVTGQNQNSGHQTAHEMMRLIAERPRT